MRKWKQTKLVWIAAGGTAGHLLPAAGVAEELVRLGIERQRVGFMGSTRPMESEILAPYGFEFLQFSMAGFTRSAYVLNIWALLKLVRATFELFLIAFSQRPMVVIGFGGYFSVPPILVARVFNIPIYTVETNVIAGRANKLLARFAKTAFAASPDSGIANADLVAVPLRPELPSLKESAVSQFKLSNGIPKGTVVVSIFGGSLGSESINRTAMQFVNRFASELNCELFIYHVFGRRDFAKFKAEAEELSSRNGSVSYKYCEFDPEIYNAIAESDIVVCRAGSGTIAELGYFGRPSILIPLPNAPGDHQVKNAIELENLGASSVIFDADLTAEVLYERISDLMGTEGALRAMSEAASRAFKGNGSFQIAEKVMECLRHGGTS